MNNISNKVVLITGGGKGIGRETAKHFASLGAKVIITGRTEHSLKETSLFINQRLGYCDYFVGDVTNIDDCRTIIESVVRQHNHIDILINNAGMSMRGLFEETELDLFHNIIAINFGGAVNMTKFALPYLKASKGSVLFISSLSALKGIPGIAPYGSAKTALTGFSESLRAELRPYHVHVGIIYVGFTENDPNKQIYDAKGELVPLMRDKNNDSQEGVAKAILKMIKRRKSVMVLTLQGKLANFLYRAFPRLSGYLLGKFALKDSRTKS